METITWSSLRDEYTVSVWVHIINKGNNVLTFEALSDVKSMMFPRKELEYLGYVIMYQYCPCPVALNLNRQQSALKLRLPVLLQVLRYYQSLLWVELPTGNGRWMMSVLTHL